MNFWPAIFLYWTKILLRFSHFGHHVKPGLFVTPLFVVWSLVVFFSSPSLFFLTFPSLSTISLCPSIFYTAEISSTIVVLKVRLGSWNVTFRNFPTRRRIKVNNTKCFFLLIPVKEKSLLFDKKKKKEKWSTLINCTFKLNFKLKFGIFIRSLLPRWLPEKIINETLLFFNLEKNFIFQDTELSTNPYFILSKSKTNIFKYYSIFYKINRYVYYILNFISSYKFIYILIIISLIYSKSLLPFRKIWIMYIQFNNYQSKHSL